MQSLSSPSESSYEMANSSYETKIFKALMPPLLHCATVKIAVQLHKEFGFEALEKAFRDIQQVDSTTARGVGDKIQRAKKEWLNIPAHLRLRVRKAVHGMSIEITDLTQYYARHFQLREVEGSFQFRTDGTIDAHKTSLNLVRNTKFDIKKRFEVACVFCLEESVEALWQEMEESGEAESVGVRGVDIVSFWVRWLCERPRVTSVQSFIHFLGALIPRSPHIFENLHGPVPKYSAIYPFLRPEQRQECLHLLVGTQLDDLRSCLYTLTKKEEEQLLLENGAYEFLCVHVFWPFQTLFLKRLENLWAYVDDHCFLQLLHTLLDLNKKFKDFDYSHLIERFWNASPLHFRYRVREYPNLLEKIVYFFVMKNRRKRKHVCSSEES